MKIAFIPIDNRPVCYNLPKDITDIDGELELLIPPREFLGDLTKIAQINNLLSWLQSIENADCFILSLDTLVYGGLIPSRRSKETLEELKIRLGNLKNLLQNKKVYAFSSIMRISNNNYNEEEKEYWSEYGKKIFEYSFQTDKTGKEAENDIPQEILNDYLMIRKRNFEVNKIFLQWQKEGIFETLIFSKDDCAEFGFNVSEARELKNLGGYIKTGADEIPLTLLARAIEKDISIFPKFIEPEYKDSISNYEDISIEKSVLGQLELGGFKIATSEKDADIVLVVNNFIKKQGEHVMNWQTQIYKGTLTLPVKPYCIADVRYANGADNAFVRQLVKNIDLRNFYGYAGWNTSANTLGSLLAGVKVRYKSKKYNENAFKKLQMIRFLDDWGYQANVRNEIITPQDISDKMQPFEKILCNIFNYTFKSIHYSYPWRRKFEIEVKIEPKEKSK